MSGLIEAVVTQAPSAGAVLERFSEFLTRVGVMMRVRYEALPGLGPAIRFEVRRLGNLSHLHIEALATILSRTDGLTGVVIVVNGGWKRFVLPTQTEECVRWFRDDRGASTPRVWSAISRMLDGLRFARG